MILIQFPTFYTPKNADSDLTEDMLRNGAKEEDILEEGTIFINPEFITGINRCSRKEFTTVRTVDDSWIIAMDMYSIFEAIKKAGIELKICR